MLALAFLFFSIFALLGLVVKLLDKYFDTYSSLQSLEEKQTLEFQHHQDQQKDKFLDTKIKEEINAIANERLAKIDEHFPKTQYQNQEMKNFTHACKNLLQSSLNLLKLKP